MITSSEKIFGQCIDIVVNNAGIQEEFDFMNYRTRQDKMRKPFVDRWKTF